MFKKNNDLTSLLAGEVYSKKVILSNLFYCFYYDFEDAL